MSHTGCIFGSKTAEGVKRVQGLQDTFCKVVLMMQDAEKQYIWHNLIKNKKNPFNMKNNV